MCDNLWSPWRNIPTGLFQLAVDPILKRFTLKPGSATPATVKQPGLDFVSAASN